MPPKHSKSAKTVEDVLDYVLDSDIECSSNSEYGHMSSSEDVLDDGIDSVIDNFVQPSSTK